MTKTALITGIWGQDGTLLAKSLLKKGFKVIGIARMGSNTPPTVNNPNLEVISINLLEYNNVLKIFKDYTIDQCYHLAACHHESTQKKVSLEQDSLMVETNFLTTKNLIHAILETGNHSRFFYAGSSQMFSPNSFGEVFTEKSPYNPSTFYGHTKIFSANLIDYYRRKHSFYGFTGILFNHESPLRPKKFISRLITQSSAEVFKGYREVLEVRNPYGVTDWSSAQDFVEGYQLALTQDIPRDLIFASGEQHSVFDIINICFKKLGLDIDKHLKFPKEAKTPQTSLIGDSSLLKSIGWTPAQSFEDLIIEMLESDLKNL